MTGVIAEATTAETTTVAIEETAVTLVAEVDAMQEIGITVVKSQEKGANLDINLRTVSPDMKEEIATHQKISLLVSNLRRKKIPTFQSRWLRPTNK